MMLILLYRKSQTGDDPTPWRSLCERERARKSSKHNLASTSESATNANVGHCIDHFLVLPLHLNIVRCWTLSRETELLFHPLPWKNPIEFMTIYWLKKSILPFFNWRFSPKILSNVTQISLFPEYNETLSACSAGWNKCEYSWVQLKPRRGFPMVKDERQRKSMSLLHGGKSQWLFDFSPLVLSYLQRGFNEKKKLKLFSILHFNTE